MVSLGSLRDGFEVVHTDGDRIIEFDTPHFAGLLVGFHLLALALVGLPDSVTHVVTVPLIVLSLTLVPGGLLLVLTDEQLIFGAREVLYIVGLSLMSLMALGAIVNIVLPMVGIMRPLEPIPLGVSVTALVLALGLITTRIRSSGQITVPLPDLWKPTPLALGLLPLVTILSVSWLNATGDNVPIILALGIVAVVPLLAVTWVSERWHAMTVWMVALAILYHKSLWALSGYGGQAFGFRAWRAGRWTPGVAEIGPTSTALLPNGILFPMYAKFGEIHILTQYEVVNPFFVSFLPLALFVMFRRYTDSSKALLASVVFAFAHPFYLQYPTAGRAATPVLFLALLGVVLSDAEVSSVVGSVLALVFSVGIVVSHYATSYFVMAAVPIALFLVLLLRYVDSIRTEGGGFTAKGRALRNRLESNDRASTVLSWTFAAFYFVTTLSWYMYMRGGAKFSQLPKHVNSAFNQLFAANFGGRTARRVTKTYGTESIQYSKTIYLLLVVLILLGLLVFFYRRVAGDEIEFDDPFLALATALFGILGVTVIVRTWGGGRPVMIAFSLTTIFAVLATVWLATTITGWIGKRASTLAPEAFFAILMGVFLVLNNGVASAVVLDGFAPSNVPNEPNLVDAEQPHANSKVYRQVDIQTNAWVLDYYGEGVIYGGEFMLQQRDLYRPYITAARERESGASSMRGLYSKVTSYNSSDIDGYVMVMGHNQNLNGFWPVAWSSAQGRVPLSEYDTGERNRIYTTGKTSIYYTSRASIRG